MRGDHADAFRLFSDAAAKGQPQAQFALAEMYRTGQGAPVDQAQALAWYRKAADLDNPGAEFAAGPGLSHRPGCRPQRAHGGGLAAEAGPRCTATPTPSRRLAGLYAQGKGVTHDDMMAMAWLQKAADQGDIDGANELAQIAAAGGHTPKQLFSAMMDRVFGAGRWRETGGFRTRAQEDALRKEGAGTVRLGEVSRHSMGNARWAGRL